MFGSKCYIINTKDKLHKFDLKIHNDIFLDYFLNNFSYRVYNLETCIVAKSFDVMFDEIKTTKEIEINYDAKKDKIVEN